MSNFLNVLLPEKHNAIRYLVNFREELVHFLEESKFLQGETTIKFDEGTGAKKKNQK